jgi:F420-dependent oxidoreductase-like protein
MRIGLAIDNTRPVAQVVAQAEKVRAGGFAFAAVTNIFGYDALTLLAAVGAQVPDVELITAVVPTYPRHPLTMAQQALTVSAVTGGRLTLGIGLSHQMVIENMFGFSFEKPARHMREYLSVLMPALAREQVSFDGETLSGTTFGPLEIDAPTPDVLVAALGPTMLKLAGTVAQGTSTWMTGPRTLETHVVPTITAAAEAAGRPAPRVMVSLPVCVTDDPDAARAQAGEVFGMYDILPSYRAMMDREGAGGPADMAIVGDAATVTAAVRQLGDLGTTDFSGVVYGSEDDQQRTFDVLAAL